MTTRVAVLLSTYNGAAFLEAQLASLAAQEDVEIEVFARDDGSSDATRQILAAHGALWPALAALAAGPNLGPAMSFLALLAAAPEGFDAYAFCDQDDVWPAGKLARATASLGAVPADRPALYCSRVLLVDAELKPLGLGPLKADGSFEHLLFENIAFGATVVTNAAAARLIVSRPPSGGVIMHDWWCALVTSAFGEVIYDPEPGLLYRQHGGNEIGQGSGRLAEAWRMARIFARAPAKFWPVQAQAAEVLRLWGDELDVERRRSAEALVASKASLANRLAFAATGKIRRASLSGAIAGRLLIAAGLY
ncbi:MAG TPA: glycosyltransferase [Caulobacteraceae bacterium]